MQGRIPKETTDRLAHSSDPTVRQIAYLEREVADTGLSIVVLEKKIPGLVNDGARKAMAMSLASGVFGTHHTEKTLVRHSGHTNDRRSLNDVQKNGEWYTPTEIEVNDPPTPEEVKAFQQTMQPGRDAMDDLRRNENHMGEMMGNLVVALQTTATQTVPVGASKRGNPIPVRRGTPKPRRHDREQFIDERDFIIA